MSDNDPACANCFERKRQMTRKAIAAEKRDLLGVSSVGKVTQSLSDPKTVPMTTWTATKSKQVHKTPIMTSFEGIRMQVPHNDSPLARWRINLRECLSYTILVTCPEQIYRLSEKLTDAQCVEVLESVQSRHSLVEGTIPARVFTVVIPHYTTLALDEGMRASESIEEGANALNHLHEDVEKWGLRPRLLCTDLIRKRIVILLTDSGALIYRPNKNKVAPRSYLRTNNSLSNPWEQLLVSCESGAKWTTWTTTLSAFIAEHGRIMEKCSDGKSRFPCHISVIVLDNLNGTNADYESKESLRSEDQRTTFDGFKADVVKQAAVDELIENLDSFKAALYCQIAPAKHWGMPEAVDSIAGHIRQRMRTKNIATLDATQFWASIKPFLGKEQLSKPNAAGGDNTGETHWHHYEDGNGYALPWHWDRYLFRLVCYMEASLIHESVKNHIFNMKQVTELSNTIKSEGLQFKLTMGEAGTSSSEIMPDVIPTSQSYRDAVSPPPSKKWGKRLKAGAPLGDKAVKSEPIKEECLGDNAGGSAASSSGAGGLPTAPTEDYDMEDPDYGDEEPMEPVAEEENDDAESPDDLVEQAKDIVKFVTCMYTDESRIYKKDDRAFFLPLWAKSPDVGKCIVCDTLYEVTDERPDETLKCQVCKGIVVIAKNVSTPIAELPWNAGDLDFVRALFATNCAAHDAKDAKARTTENDKSLKKVKDESSIHQAFGHDQTAIEGYPVSSEALKKALLREKAERDAKTELTGAIKAVPIDEDPIDDAAEDCDEEETPNPDRQEADEKEEDPFGQSQFNSLPATVHKSAKEAYHTMVATLEVIPSTLYERRSKKIVENAVRNDDREAIPLAANDVKRITEDAEGRPYTKKGASTVAELLKQVGPPPRALELKLADVGVKLGFKWVIVDECLPLPKTTLTFLARSPELNDLWNEASRAANRVLRYGGYVNGNAVQFEKGGWLSTGAVLCYVKESLLKNRRRSNSNLIQRISTEGWLLGLMKDTERDKTVKSRYQLAGVLNKKGVMFQIKFVRNKSGHGEDVASKFIPGDSLYTTITKETLPLIACICHKTKFEHMKSIFSYGLIPGGEDAVRGGHKNKRAHTNLTPFPPFDSRNLAAGRFGNEYDVVIVFKSEEMLRYHLSLSQNAILVTKDTVPSDVIDIVYVVPPTGAGNAWVLYRPDLKSKPIMGHTAPSHGKSAFAPTRVQEFPRSSTCGWRACPNCRAANPKGFTACLHCRVLFTFDEVDKVGKVANNRAVAEQQRAAVSKDKVIQLAVASAKLLERRKKGFTQRFQRPGDHFWEFTMNVLKWRIKFDEMTRSEQQS